MASLNPKDFNKIIYEWNQTKAPFPDKTIQQLFEEQVLKTPDNIAVVFGNIQLTYQQLNQKANQLAHYLRQTYQIKGDDLIALCLDRSEKMLIAILGVLKSGAAYVPIAPSYPQDRIDYMLSDTKAKVLITNAIYQKRFAKNKSLTIDDQKTEKSLKDYKNTNPIKNNNPDNIAYVIYTSGTTGTPKGVMIEHKSLVNEITFQLSNFKFKNPRSLLTAEYVFDVSVEHIFISLLLGSQLHIVAKEYLLNIPFIESYIIKNKINWLDTTPSYVSNLSKEVLSKINLLFLGGEQYLKHLDTPGTVLNCYGPTETCIGSTITAVKANQLIHIGRPLANTKIYILNSHLNPVPIGEQGELFIGGIGLARGYLNQPELTAQKFIANPFEPNERMYKTGDLAYYLPDGNIEFIGRVDLQIKIRGYRVELGEIETTLAGYPGVKQAAIGVQEQQNKCLVGYYVSDQELDNESLKKYLSKSLPEYMVPVAFMKLEKLPLTINGKLDRKALPVVEFSHIDTYVAPCSKIEIKLVKIWSEVLGINKDKIGINDDFYGLGGNSITAIKLLNQLKSSGVNLSMRDILTHTNISRIASLLGNKSENFVIKKHVFANEAQQELSFAQERLWFIESYEQGSGAYNIPIILKISGLDKTKLTKSILKIVERHEILRTLILDHDGKPYQKVCTLEEKELPITTIKVEKKSDLDQLLSKDINHVYNLSNEYPIQVSYYEVKETQELYLSIVIHHIAFDGWSNDIFLEELSKYYSSNTNLPELYIQYKDFAIWQKKYLSGEVLSRQLAYWKDQLTGFELLNMPIDKIRPKIIDYKGGRVSFNLGKRTSSQLRRLAKDLKVSLYSVLLSGYYLFLRSYSNQNDIVIGTPVANRHYSGIENLIGFFVNTLVLRSNIDPTEYLISYIQAVGKNVQEAQLYQDLPFEKLVAALSLEKDTSRNPVFQNVFGVQNFGNDYLPGVEEYKLEDNIARFDITTMIDDSTENLYAQMEYAASLYDLNTIKKFINTFKFILKQLSQLNTNSTIKINQLNYLDIKDYHKIVLDWNNTFKNFPINKTIHQIFEDQVKKTPNNIAIVCQDTTLTYKQLNHKANQFAHYLRDQYKIQGDDLCALCLDKNETMIIAILGVLKAGAAYVPMDPGYPADRIKYMLSDMKAKVLITNKNNILNVDGQSIEKLLLNRSTLNPSKIVTPNNLAYVIYTSGTTGKPKGVMVNHVGVVSLVKGITYVDISESDCILQLADTVFDAATFEIWGAILNGAKLYIPSETLGLVADISLFRKTIESNAISILWLTKTLFDELYLQNNELFRSLKYLLVGGEALNYKIINELVNSKNRPKHFINGYGPTENTTFSCTMEVDANALKARNSVPIGKPINNRSAYILDSSLKPSPLGGIGELYVGGAGISRGYLNNPELTAQKFVPNPFQENTKLYKTGDLVRYLLDGNIEYIGRVDFQVKIRGFRIELEEIETRILNYSGIRQTVVLVQGSQDKYLVGYYVAENQLDKDALTKYLSNYFPNYMMPAALVQLDKFPLTINGKLDRKALPIPEFTNDETYVAPNTEIEKKLVKIWSAVLSIDEGKLSINDDFFKLGGDSIKSIQLVSRLRQHLGLHVNIKDIFNYKTIDNLYKNIIASQLLNTKKAHIIREEGVLNGDLKFLPIQKWFFDHIMHGEFNKPGHWNQSFLIKTKELNCELLKSSLVKLVEYHDALRINYKKTKKLGIVQFYNVKINVPKLHILDLNTLENSKDLDVILTGWQSHFELMGDEPLYSFGYINGYKDGSARIFIAAHHLIIDSVSWRILSADLMEIYSHLESETSNNVETILGYKGTSYRQWINVVNEYPQKHTAENKYWKQMIQEVNKYNKHLTNLIENKNVDKNIIIELDKNYTRKLLSDSHIAFNTEINDLLLTAFNLSLVELTGCSINYITLEGHGREAIVNDIDINHTVGWFTTMFPICLTAHGDLSKSIIATKEHLRLLPNKGIGFGALYGYSKLPCIVFNYLGQFENITSESSGIAVSLENKDSNIIEANGYISDGKLIFDISAKLSQDNLSKFSNIFLERLREIIHYTVNLQRSYLTVSDIDNIISPEYLDILQNNTEVSNIFLANNLQQGFIYHAINQGKEDTAYRIQMIYRYHNELNPDLYKKSWEYAIAKFPGLRLRFSWEDELVQVIDKSQKLNWHYIDISSFNMNEQETKIRELMAADRQENYQLDQGGLLRIYLIKQSLSLYTSIISNHHIILDGWSVPILLDYVHQTYLNLKNNMSITQSEDTCYLQIQKYLQNTYDSTYWLDSVNQIEDHTDLGGLIKPLKHKVNLKTYTYILDRKKKEINISGILYKNIKSFAKSHGFTINAILQYCWHSILSIYGNSKTTIVGTTISGRNLPIDNIEQSVGLYINTLPLIVNHEEAKTIFEMISSIQISLNEMSAHGNMNLAKLQKDGQRLFESLLVFENYPDQNAKMNGLNVNFETIVEDIDYPLCLTAMENKEKIILEIEYAGELFSKNTIKDLLDTINLIIKQVIENPKQLHVNINYLLPKYYKKIIYDWNETDKKYPKNKTIHQLFEEQVKKTPNNIAVVYGDVKLTYQELNHKANQLAHHLRKTYKIKGDDPVALCLDRSDKMLIAILGVLKSGGAYVPMDPEYPDDRVKYILSDIKTKATITNKNNVLSINDKSIEKLLLKQSISNPELNISSKNLAYIIYTSGTTGKPKGVMIEHQSVVNEIKFQNDSLNFKNQKTLLTANYVFDAAVEQIFMNLLSGSTLHLVNKETLLDMNLLDSYINKAKITCLNTTPSYISNLSKDALSKIKVIILGGEQYLHPIDTSALVLNSYGPTETTIVSTTTLLKPNEPIHIGCPIANTKVYVLDAQLHPVPIGAIGELYIGGAGLARGYLNNPELTAQKFINNPFEENSRIYKTGDLVRYLPDGNIEYIGRSDFQVKIRGFRIELGEVESVLAHFPNIKQTVVLACGGENKYLVGYYVADQEIDKNDLNQYLSEHLPEYMIPAIFMKIDKLPLTINGKIDRRALPDTEFTSTDKYIAPRSEIEKQLVKIWSEVLDVKEENLGINDDFFKLGGNSILSIKLLSKINHSFNSQLKISDLFVSKTINQLKNKVALTRTYEPTVKLNNTTGKPNLFMIHPGHAGCEVYHDLAERLSDKFSCFGVDSYNLYHTKKINKLTDLAKYYLQSIKRIMEETKQDNYYILGWSLGGVIALEVAALLESEGITNIKIYLLDSVYHYTVDDPEEDNALKKHLLAQGFSQEYVDNILTVSEVDEMLNKQTISCKLHNTKIVLYKALLRDDTYDAYEAIKSADQDVINNIKYNNIDQAVANLTQLSVIQLEQAHHSNILGQIINFDF